MGVRKELETEILKMFDDADPSGRNTDRMNDLFKSMNDTQFKKFFIDFFEDVDKNYSLAYLPMDNNVTMDFIYDLLDKYDIEVYETVYQPYLNKDVDDPPGTPHKIPVLDYPIPRLQQMAFKKNQTSLSITKRNPETGQVTDTDKTARLTDLEAYSLIVYGQYDSAREFYGLRADDMNAKTQAIKQIAETGELVLEDIESSALDKKTMNTINYYALGSGIKTNFIDKSGYLLPNTLKAKEDKEVTIKR